MTRGKKCLTLENRVQLEARLKDGMSIKDATKDMGMHVSTIYRELKRGYVWNEDGTLKHAHYGPVYNAEVAHRTFVENMRRRGNRPPRTEQDA